MKSTENFKKVIQSYLEQRAQTDPLFAASFAKKDKTIDDCVTYIINQVQKSGCNAFEDSEIYSMAVHYYDEDNIETGPATDCTIVTNHKAELTPEEIEEAKSEARKRIVDDEYNSLKKKHVPKHAETKPENQQLSLF